MTIEQEEGKYPKQKIWLVWTQDSVTYTSSLRSICSDRKLAEFHEKVLKDGIRRAREGEHSGEREQRVVVIEESDTNHLYGERTLRAIRDLKQWERRRAI